MGNSTDGGQLFYPAIWPAPFCHKGSTSKQPRQAAQECGKVPWAAFANIFKAVPAALKCSGNGTEISLSTNLQTILILDFFSLLRKGPKIQEENCVIIGEKNCGTGRYLQSHSTAL